MKWFKSLAALSTFRYYGGSRQQIFNRKFLPQRGAIFLFVGTYAWQDILV